jgi:hypothetical protein
MRIAIFAAMAVLLTGCVTGAVTSVGKDTYTMSASRCGICEPVQGYVTSKAGAYCNSIGKNLVVRGVTGNNVQPWAPGSATITFSCLSSDDPDYMRPATLRPDNGVTTIEQRPK